MLLYSVCDHIFRPFFAAIITMKIVGMHAALKSMPVYSYVEPYITLFLLSLILVVSYYYLRNSHHELVKHIRSGPAELMLDKPLGFRRRMYFNPCGFNEFLLALQSSKTIRTVRCGSHLALVISEDEWVLLIKTLGSIKGIEDLHFCCRPGSRDFHPFQAGADAVNSAHSLRVLGVGIGDATFPSDPSGVTALANALRKHTSLQEFILADSCHRLVAAQEDTLDPVLRALPTCPHLQKVIIKTRCASADAMKNLLQLQSTTELLLVLTPDHWLAVADEIRRGHCNVQRLNLILALSSTSGATEAVKAVASAIRLDQNLEHLTLIVEDGFTDEGCVALAEALTVNKTLRKMTLSSGATTFGAHVYEAFSAMLSVNTNLVLELHPFEYDGADERLLEAWHQMGIELRLNQVGRGKLLSSSLTTREEYVDALHELNTYNAKESLAFQVSCLYSLLRSKPSVACMP
jgi:hypothetical protein